MLLRMTGEIHHQIMTKMNNEMRKSNRHILYVCDNASSHQVREYSHIKFLMLPPNATSIMQPLDQGIILSAKRRYKKKLTERYLICVENNKDANFLLNSLDIVAATNMIAASWRETSAKQSYRTVFVRQALNTMQLTLPPKKMSLYLVHPQMCGTESKSGWVR